MKRVLVAYATMAGSTMEVAEAVGEEIAKQGVQVDVQTISEITDLQNYDGVVIGGPMIMGWHRGAQRFIRKHRAAFQKIPLAVFVMAMSLTKTAEKGDEGIVVDEGLPKPPADESKLTFRERYARLDKYLAPIFRAVRPAKPVSVGIFGGRLEYGRLKWWAVLFVMLVIQAPAGDRRNWDLIRSWAAGLPERMRLAAAD